MRAVESHTARNPAVQAVGSSGIRVSSGCRCRLRLRCGSAGSGLPKESAGPGFQDGVEIVDAAVESGEADHFVARGDLHGVVGDGVAVAGLVEGEAVDTKLEDRIFVCKFAYAPEPECVGYVVFAVGRFQDEVTSAADGECSFLFERIASGRFSTSSTGRGRACTGTPRTLSTST